MSFTISAEDPRSIRAITIAASASSWLRVTTGSGRRGYGIPSACQPGRFYLVSADECDCTDRQRHPVLACKHILAVRLHEELTRAVAPKRPTPLPRPVLEMVRHPDGEVSWKEHSHTADLARRYSQIQRDFSEED
jgi:hypothetical protein